MISLKELQYVSKSSDKAPYPGDKYAYETLENMIEAFNIYKKNYEGKDYSIIFSDSEELNFQIFDYNICHMLGVDFSFLVNNNEKFLREILNLKKENVFINSYEVIYNILQNYKSNDNRVINYYKSRIKCAIFNKMNEFEMFNFGKLNTENSSKILYVQSNEAVCPYFLIRLNENNKDKDLKYCVTSLLAPKENELPAYFEYKSAIPTQMIIDDGMNKLDKFESTPREKLNMLNMYKSIISTYSIPDNLDISGDYKAVLASLDNKKILKK